MGALFIISSSNNVIAVTCCIIIKKQKETKKKNTMCLGEKLASNWSWGISPTYGRTEGQRSLFVQKVCRMDVETFEVAFKYINYQ